MSPTTTRDDIVCIYGWRWLNMWLQWTTRNDDQALVTLDCSQISLTAIELPAARIVLTTVFTHHSLKWTVSSGPNLIVASSIWTPLSLACSFSHCWTTSNEWTCHLVHCHWHWMLTLRPMMMMAVVVVINQEAPKYTTNSFTIWATLASIHAFSANLPMLQAPTLHCQSCRYISFHTILEAFTFGISHLNYWARWMRTRAHTHTLCLCLMTLGNRERELEPLCHARLCMDSIPLPSN